MTVKGFCGRRLAGRRIADGEEDFHPFLLNTYIVLAVGGPRSNLYMETKEVLWRKRLN